MSGYLDYNSGDLMTILIFGGMFFLFGYASVGAVYIAGYKGIRQNQITLSSLIIKAIVLQLVSVLFVFVIIWLLEIQGRTNNLSTITFTESTATFFLVDWSTIDIKAIVDSINADDSISELERGAKLQGVSMFVMLKVLWAFLTVIFVFVPIALIIVSMSNILQKHKENKNGTLEIVTDFASSLALVYFLFTVHLTIPQIILHNMYERNKTAMDTKIGSARKMTDFSYRARAGNYIIVALDKIINATNEGE